MEDYTYHLGPGRAEDPRRAHARGLPVASPTASPALRDPPAGHRRPRGPGAAGLRRRARARPSSSASPTCGDRFRLVANEVDVVAAGRAAAEAAGRPRGLEARARPRAPRPRRWLTAGGPHHTVLSTAVGTEALVRLRRDARHRAARHRRRHHRRAASPTSSAGTRPTTGSPRACPTRGAEHRTARPHQTTGHSPADRTPTDGEAMKLDTAGQSWPGRGSGLTAVAACGAATRSADRRASSGGTKGALDRRRDADQVLRALDRRRRQHQGRSWRPRATRSTCSTPRTTSRPRSTRSRTMITKGAKVLIIASIDGTALDQRAAAGRGRQASRSSPTTA